MKLTVTTSNVKPQRNLPLPARLPDSFTIRQLDEAMKWLRESKRERKPAHAKLRAR